MSSIHKNWVRDVFDRAASQYGEKSCAFFNYFGRRLVEQLDIPPNPCVLDVATGRGAVLFPLAEAIGSSGHLIGIDISTQMLHETAIDAEQRNMHWIDFQCMDAEKLDFPDNFFDFVFCGFGLFFLPSLSTALSEFKRVLKPGAQLAVSIWGKDSELKTWLSEETRKLFANKKSLAATSLRNEEALRMTLNNAQFSNIRILEETKPFLHDTPQEWWDGLWGHGTRAMLERCSFEQLANLHEKALKKAASLQTKQGIVEELQVFYGFAQKS